MLTDLLQRLAYFYENFLIKVKTLIKIKALIKTFKVYIKAEFFEAYGKSVEKTIWKKCENQVRKNVKEM